MIDHFYILDKNGKTQYEAQVDNANNLMKVAKILDVRLIVVAQTKKPSDKTKKGQEYEKVKTEDFRGAKELVDASEYCLGLNRSQEDDFIIEYTLLKNRRGPVGFEGKLTKLGTYFKEED